MRRRPQRAIRTATLFPYTSPFRYQARDAALERIEPIDGVVGMSTCGLVIEAATEREEIKRSIFEDVGKVLGHQAVLASNSSSIPIPRLAQEAPDHQRFNEIGGESSRAMVCRYGSI